jgi:hypothetical protein
MRPEPRGDRGVNLYFKVRPHAPHSSTPAGPVHQALALHRRGPRSVHDEGSRLWRLSRLNHTASALAVYASQAGLPRHHARLASGCWPDSSGRACLPAGFQRKVSRCILHSFLLSQVQRSARTGSVAPIGVAFAETMPPRCLSPFSTRTPPRSARVSRSRRTTDRRSLFLPFETSGHWGCGVRRPSHSAVSWRFPCSPDASRRESMPPHYGGCSPADLCFVATLYGCGQSRQTSRADRRSVSVVQVPGSGMGAEPPWQATRNVSSLAPPGGKVIWYSILPGR